MKSIKNALIYMLIFIPTVVVLCIYGYIGIFNRLIADSFCSYYYADRFGLLRSIWYWRINWSGRYSAYAFDWLIQNIYGINIGSIVFTFLAIWTLALIILGYTLLNTHSYQENKHLPLILGPLVMFTIFISAPDIRQSFIWLDGFRAYSLPLILLTIYAILYVRLSKNTNQGKWSLVITFVLCFVSGGLSETFAVFQLSLLGFFILYYLIINQKTKLDKHSIIMVVGFAATLASLLVIITAPGNKIRENLLPPHLGIMEITQISLRAYINFIHAILESPQKLTGILGAILFLTWAGSFYNKNIGNQKVKSLLLVAGGIVLSFICFPPGVYGYGEPPPGRTLMIPLFILLVLTLVSSFITGNFYKTAIRKSKYTENLILVSASFLIFISAYTNSITIYNSRTVYIDFSERWDSVNEMILTAREDGKESVQIPALENWANLDRPNQNPKHWLTKCYSDFYDIQVFAPPYIQE